MSPEALTPVLHQCPGCWSWSMRTPDRDYECECGQRLSVVDLRGQEAADPSGLRGALSMLAAEARIVIDRTPIMVDARDLMTAIESAEDALAAGATERPLDVERLALAMKSIDLDMADLPGGESLSDPADDPIRREYAAEVARRYARLATATPEAGDA
jgi:hypothetical protein